MRRYSWLAAAALKLTSGTATMAVGVCGVLRPLHSTLTLLP